MPAPAGPCEWCGGPQWWTFIRGEMYVACKRGCAPLPLEGLVPPEGVDPEVGDGWVDFPWGREVSYPRGQ